MVVKEPPGLGYFKPPQRAHNFHEKNRRFLASYYIYIIIIIIIILKILVIDLFFSFFNLMFDLFCIFQFNDFFLIKIFGL
jgi:hypothetical protein